MVMQRCVRGEMKTRNWQCGNAYLVMWICVCGDTNMCNWQC